MLADEHVQTELIRPENVDREIEMLKFAKDSSFEKISKLIQKAEEKLEKKYSILNLL